MKSRKFIPDLLLLVSIFLILPLNGQVSVGYLIGQEPEFQARYEVRPELNGFKVKMNFSGDSVLNPGVVKRLGGNTILMVDLVYSDYRSVKTFDQPNLNISRMNKLKKLLPEAFQNPAIVWNFIAQTGCNSPVECTDFFHGFVVYYREPVTEATRLLEIEKLDCAIKNTVYWDTIKKFRVIKKYEYLPRSNKKREAGIRYERAGICMRKEILVIDTIPLRKPRTRKRVVSEYSGNCTLDSVKPVKIVSHGFVWGNSDTVVQAVLNRNKEWKDMVVAVDVTGSMYPYTEQVYKWLALQTNLQRVRSFTFFNDGDNKMDNVKIAGNTGGIYDCDKRDFTTIVAHGRAAMYKGGGGDAPENDIEAILHIQEKFRSVKEVILIADNYANMRDIAFLESVKVPVRVILCGASWGVNTQYLKLARATGGSIHTIEEDITNLAILQAGEVIKIGKNHYEISATGEFTLVKGS